jgi:hypothetical protein
MLLSYFLSKPFLIKHDFFCRIRENWASVFLLGVVNANQFWLSHIRLCTFDIALGKPQITIFPERVFCTPVVMLPDILWALNTRGERSNIIDTAFFCGELPAFLYENLYLMMLLFLLWNVCALAWIQLRVQSDKRDTSDACLYENL